MAEITDDAILETADQLVRELALTEDDRDVITLRIQRLVWPPSVHYFMHERPYLEIEIAQREHGGWQGELRCPHGCARRWRVNIATTEDAVHQALTAAHQEYRTGMATSVPVSTSGSPQRRMTLTALLGRVENVEVQDDHYTGRP